MDVPMITMDPEAAQAKLTAYRESLRRRADEEHEAAAAAYEALADGTPLINLSEAIQQGGFDDKGRPRLAVARADRKQVRFDQRRFSQRGTFDTHRFTSWGSVRGRTFESLSMTVDMGSQAAERVTGYALVPMIPAEVRNRMVGQPRDHHILWEVEAWSERPITAAPDEDPLLLKHIHGDLYAVVDEWDLTEIERLVMTGRREL